MTRQRRRCRATLCFAAALAAALTAGCAHLFQTREEKAMLVLDGPALRQCQIVVPAEPTEAEARAGSELQRYLREITGVEVRLVPESAPPQECEILLGHTARQRDEGLQVDWAALREDGFAIRTVGDRLVIAGGSGLGTLYGVYAFLEDYLGCRMYVPGVMRIPRHEALRLPAIDTVYVPPIAFRETYYTHAYDPEWAAWHRVDHNRDDWGMWVHTFASLIPPERYFADHPEWFAQVKGQRIPNGQLCLTDEGLYQELVRNLRQRLAEKPQAHYWSVSQNDTHGYCECDRCRAIDEAEGSPSGSLLAFVNRVAAEFPDKTISTLAYQYSRSAPRTIRPAANVNIVLCTIELNRSRPIATDPGAASFRRDMEDWAAICDNILIWDYVIQFSNLVSPFPNLRVLQPNVRYFLANHSVAHFQQGNREVGGEMAELRAYLIAKLLWNPEADVGALMDDFLNGYYGAAGPFLRAYIDRMHDVLEASGEPLSIFGNPHTPPKAYLSKEMLAECSALFDRAEAAVAGDAEVLARVRYARLPIQYAALEQAKTRATGADGLFVQEADGWKPRPDLVAAVDRFVATANEQGVTRVTEWHTTPTEYGERYRHILERVPTDNLATNRPITYVTPYSPKYPAAGDATLVDGLLGPLDHSYNWLGWEGADMEVVVDLESVRPLRHIAADFLQSVGSWIFLPRRVEFSASVDGTTWKAVGCDERDADERRGGVFAETFAADLEGVEARYVKVAGRSLRTCPDWHIGGGGPCWIFADEVVVR
ncbi:MAG: DUF4838 domain-containing protein [Gemmatimonadota bacterium]